MKISWKDFVKAAGPSTADRAAAGDRAAAQRLAEQRRSAAQRAANPSFFDGKRYIQAEGRNALARATPEQQRKFWDDFAQYQSDAMGYRAALASAMMPGMGVAGGMALDGVSSALQGMMQGKGLQGSVRGGVADAFKGAAGGKISGKVVPVLGKAIGRAIPSFKRMASPFAGKAERIANAAVGRGASEVLGMARKNEGA